VTVPQSAAGIPSGGTAWLVSRVRYKAPRVSRVSPPRRALPPRDVFAVRFLTMCGIDNSSNGHPQDAPMDTSEGPPSKTGGREPDRTSVALPFWAGLAPWLGPVVWRPNYILGAPNHVPGQSGTDDGLSCVNSMCRSNVPSEPSAPWSTLTGGSGVRTI